MEGQSAFIQECAVEDEEWKWSPVYLLLRYFSDLARDWNMSAKKRSLVVTYHELENK
jgi:hypothetical protein